MASDLRRIGVLSTTGLSRVKRYREAFVSTSPGIVEDWGARGSERRPSIPVSLSKNTFIRGVFFRLHVVTTVFPSKSFRKCGPLYRVRENLCRLI